MAIMDFFKSKEVGQKDEPVKKSRRRTKKDYDVMHKLNKAFAEKYLAKIQSSFTVNAEDHAIAGVAQDATITERAKGQWRGELPLAQLSWYSSQGFLGYHICAIIAQHWLVDKACSMPARDAARVGYDINFKDLDKEKVKTIKKNDIKNRLTENLIEYEKLNRVYGMRFAMMKIKGVSDDFYEKPFNIDGVKKGSFEGIVQIDPSWVTPHLGDRQLNDPMSVDFYEPLYWMIGGKKVHKSHLVINRTGSVPDLLKPQYNYGGIPLTQRIFERVYAAEITANEGPKLAVTKRTDYFQTDIEAAKLDTEAFIENLEIVNQFKDNYQLQIIDTEDNVIRQDTSLADLDAVIMTQYQLVAAVADMPATKLINTQPKGFNSTGDYETQSYHESLESIQTHSYNPFLDRYYQVMTKSEFGEVIEIEVSWAALDSPSEDKWADINLKKAQTAQTLFGMGAIDGEDERARIIEDKDSGYNNLKNLEINPDDESETDFDVDKELEKINANE